MPYPVAAVRGKNFGRRLWTPASPTSGGVSPHTWHNLSELYQDSAKTTPAVSDGDVVGAEVNQGSDTHDVIQATTINKPLLKLNILGGKPMLLFDGVNDRLMGAFGGGLLSQPLTIFIVMQLDATVVNDDKHRFALDGDDATNRIVVGKNQASTPDGWGIYGGTWLTGSKVSDSNWNIWCVLCNGLSSQYWHDGTSVASGDAGTNSLDGLIVGDQPGGSLIWKGYIGQRLIYPGNLSNADKNQIGQYLANFYGLTWTDIT